MANDKDYRVGYKKPPIATRFKPGQSGNPAGRPKGRKNMKATVLEAFDREVQVSFGHKKRTVRVFDAIVHRLVISAAAGDLKAIAHVLNLARLYDGDDPDEQTADPEAEAQRLELLRQLLNPRRGGNDGSGQ